MYKKFRTLLAFMIVTVLALGIFSCSGAEDAIEEYTMKNVPDQYSVQIPKSVNGSETSDELVAKGFVGSTDDVKNSLGYRHLKEAMMEVELENSKLEIFFILADAAIDKTGKYFDAPQDITVDITDEMLERVDAVKERLNKYAELPDTQLSSAKKDSIKKLLKGIKNNDKVTLQKMAYVDKDNFSKIIDPNRDKPLLDQKDMIAAEYSKMIKFGGFKFGTYEDADFKEGNKVIFIMWNDDKTAAKVFSLEVKKFPVDGKDDKEVKIKDIMFKNYGKEGKFASIMSAWDSAPYVWDEPGKKWKLKHSDDAKFRDVDFSRITIKEVDSTTNAIMYNFMRKQRKLMGDPSKADSMKTFEHNIKGYADNTGAYIGTDAKKERERNSGGVDETGIFKDDGFASIRADEVCKENGDLLGARFWSKATGNWADVPNYTWPGDENTHYAAFKKYKAEYETKRDDFEGKIKVKDVMNKYLGTRDIVIEIKIPASLRAVIDAKTTVNGFPFVISKADAADIMGTNTTNIIGKAFMLRYTYAELKAAKGENDIRLAVVLKKDPNDATISKDNVPATIKLWLVQVDATTGVITATDKASVTKVADDKVNLYQ